MLRRIVEISGEGRKLSLERGFLAVSCADGLLGRVPLDDIEAVVAATPAISYSGQLLAALAARGAPVVICGERFTPVMWLLPVDGHHAQGDRMEAQADSDRPVRKRLWAEIVAAKIEAQALALEKLSVEAEALKRLKAGVRSGDPGNAEALAAQKYFPLMFGHGFRRDRDGGDVNLFLNYGYTVLRAAAARAIVAAGLNPSLGLFHRSRGDALRLADDLMEPFRPAVDLAVRALAQGGRSELDTAAKRELVNVLYGDYATSEGRTPLTNCLARLAISLAQVFMNERKKLSFPAPLVPLPEQPAGDEP
ncbi:MAG: type II CRISPR-associated endonuclease Cas1 [Methylocystaceae bacterium]|nr:MAG: type II CRISPR-associated endonuclease Cas1 [Methylocystaceae bacterium]